MSFSMKHIASVVSHETNSKTMPDKPRDFKLSLEKLAPVIIFTNSLNITFSESQKNSYL